MKVSQLNVGLRPRNFVPSSFAWAWRMPARCASFVASAWAWAVAAMKAISASRTACRIGSFVDPSNVMLLMTVLIITPRWMNSRIVPVTS